MNASPHIRYLRRQEIDLAKWDACIDKSPNRVIYGTSWYLDYMTAGKWGALILGDYDAIMPLCHNTKWAIRYCYQPAFTQQLGIFVSAAFSQPFSPDANSPLSPDLIAAFLTALRRHFRFAEIFLNHGNAHPSLLPQTNLILPLNRLYETIAASYSKNGTRNLKDAGRAGYRYTSDIGLATAMTLHKDLYHDRTPHVKNEMYARFTALCTFLQKKGQLVLRAALSAEGAPLAITLLPQYGERLYLLESTVLPAGQDSPANHFLIDQLIREFAGQPLTLDFEGSEIPGIARFYRHFGAITQPYYFHRHNDLPWPLWLLKPASFTASSATSSPPTPAAAPSATPLSQDPRES